MLRNSNLEMNFPFHIYYFAKHNAIIEIFFTVIWSVHEH